MNINFTPIKRLFQTIGRAFWQRIFLFFLLFLFFDFLFVGILFVKYYFKSPSISSAEGSLTLLNQVLLRQALDHWEAGQAVIEKLPAKEYPNFFQGSSVPPAVRTTSSAATSSEQ